VTAYPNNRGEEAAAGSDRRRSTAPATRVLIALTNDPALSRAVQELVATGIEVGIVQTAQALCDELVQHSSAIALIDSATVDTPIDALVDAIAGQFPDLRLLVAGHSTEQTLLATRIEKQKVFRFVHKPASSQRLKLFLDSVGRHSDMPRPAAPVVRRPAPKASSSFASPGMSLGGRSTIQMAGIGLGVVLVIALGVWALWPKSPGSAAKATSTAAAAKASASAPAAELVQKADQAFAAGRYVATDGTSAAEMYRDALKLDAGSTVAKSGFDRSIEFGLRSAEEALLANRLDTATGVAETLRLLVPNNSRLTFLQTQIDRESARINADVSQRQVLEARQNRIGESLEAMSTAMGRGALIDPARNSAVLHFRAAANVNAADPAVRNARESLVAALLTAADNELGAQRLPQATRYVDTAASINSGAPGLDVMRRRIRELQTQSETEAAAVAAVAASTTTPPVSDAAPDPTEARTAAAPTIVAESTLQRVSAPNPTYPQRALEQLVSGWVEMQFTVTPDGSVQNVEVMDSEPGNTFDRSAAAALRRWRYQPVMRDGQAVAQRAQIRMRFTATDGTR
jgi:TonB family protein